MDAEIKQKWVDELRSGRRKQGYGGLRKVEDDSFCCLGVLCEIICPNQWVERGVGVPFYAITYEEADGRPAYGGGLMPNALSKRVGLSSYDKNDLMVMNDQQKKTFPEIADWIEVNL
jgi:hypothetical protein